MTTTLRPRKRILEPRKPFEVRMPRLATIGHGKFYPDNLSQRGAQDLARKIEAHWQGRVRCSVEPYSNKAAVHVTVYCVRSDMVGALPVKHEAVG